MGKVYKSDDIDWIDLPKEPADIDTIAEVIAWELNTTECYEKSVSLMAIKVRLKQLLACRKRNFQPLYCADFIDRSNTLNLVSSIFINSR